MVLLKASFASTLLTVDFEWSQQQSCSQSLRIVLAVRGQAASFRGEFRHLGVSWFMFRGQNFDFTSELDQVSI